MQGSSLPIWVVICILSVAVALIGGISAPYVSKKDKMRAEAFLYSTNKEHVPTITISSRPYFSWIIFFLLGCVIAAVVFYFKESFAAAVAYVGLGVVGEILVVIAVVFLAVIFLTFLLLIILLVANSAGSDLEKYYRRHYGVEVRVLSDE